MEAPWLNEYQVAFFIGLVVIWIFAWKQFTQPSYERYRRFEEILQLLQPQDLRSSGVFFPAYIFYALILSALYWVLCTFGSLQLLYFLGLNVLGVDSPGDSVGALLPTSWTDPSVLVELTASNSLTSEVTRVFQGERDLARNPTVPLTIALAIVGIIPNVKFFVTFEEKLRVVAHRLAGIPGRLIEGTRFLVDTDLRPTQNGKAAPAAHVATPAPAEGYEPTIEACARLADRDPNVARKLLYKIFFFRDLVAGQRSEIAWPSYSVQSAYQAVSDKIIARIAELENSLEKLRRFAKDAGDAPAQPIPDERKLEIRKLWDDSVSFMQQIENDICVLLLVYAEKDGVPGGRTQASAKLRNFILQAHQAAALNTVGFNVFVNILVTIVLIAGIFALLFGFDSAQGQSRDLSYVFNYVVTALMTYTFATVVALTYRQVTVDTTWSSIYREHWIKGVMQLVVVFLLASAISFVSLCVWNIYVAVAQFGNIVIVERWDRVVRFALQQEWPRGILGGFFAVFIVLGMDFWDTRSEAGAATPRAQAGLGPALLGGLVLGIWGAAVIVILAWQNAQPLNDSHMIKNAALAFLIGAVSGYVVQATLRSVEPRPVADPPAPTTSVARRKKPRALAPPQKADPA